MVLPDLVRSGLCWFLSFLNVSLVMLGLVVWSSTLFSLGSLMVCVLTGSGSTKRTFLVTGIGMAHKWVQLRQSLALFGVSTT